jgi:N-glycosylase/DNA lyase
MAIWLDAPGFDLASTLNSGQVFHWREEADGAFTGCAGNQILWLRQEGDQVRVEPETEAARARHYLRLDDDHAEVLRSFPTAQADPVLAAAVAYCPGLRLLRQPLWECLASFLTSSLKQVAHIRQISLRLRRELGRSCQLGEFHADAYPEPVAMAEAGEQRLRELGLGYRAGYVHRAALRLARGEIRLEDGEGLSDADLLEFLLQFDGVGEKIANCVRLFAYGRLAAFPVDVWIERVLRERYFEGRELPRKELTAFLVNHFGSYGGYAQQYLFHHARTSRENSRSRP